jgi:hypothetical protein
MQLTVTRPLDECICRTAEAKISRAADDVDLSALYARPMSRSDRALDRVGAVAGIAAVVLFVAAINVTPTLPSPNHGVDAIARSARDNADGYLTALYLGALLTGALLVFGSAVAARLRRSEPEGGWWLIALVGIAASAVGLVTDILVLTFVRAVGHGVRGETLWVAYPAGADGLILAIPLAVFFLGTGLGIRLAGGLSRRLGWFALVLAALFVVGGASVMGDEVDGGPLGVPLFLGFVGLLVWTTWASISLWRGSRGATVWVCESSPATPRSS